ncbi:MAG: hypothetical protein UW60_C0005G0019 [Candidatus Woesebacteria bacterium GW2011_GWA2_44_33]|uniref:SCP domain-containing protein n=1 Tax=Candidatus Woesebacteria bacterium GW2011_GWA2_44_33 TaxID=1618564 RepID=A0A0G1J893_9BACT|nr:MAG: hypothetical protein UW60_C0005G0019 [Candidatus Woesebacteria bacterium GW2011_GWA2_44_33]
MKIFLRLVLLCAGIGIIIYGLKTIPLKNYGIDLTNRSIYVERNQTPFLPNWSINEVLTKINIARERSGFSKVKVSDKLNQAALSRLSVILTENDYEGKTTGLTREVAIKNAGYEANLIGDLLLTDFFKSNDPVMDWLANDISKGTLLHPDFREAGIAIKNGQDKVSVYVILVSPRKIVPPSKQPTWGGPDLWDLVNKRRVELGVNPLRQKDELCTIASIRLNALLELGKLDGHAGFVPVLERPDLKWISEKYNVSEFLAQGYSTPLETIKAWENTLGHKALLAGGEYVWGCIYAQNTFAVAIAAY